MYDKKQNNYNLLFKHLHQREFIFPDMPMDYAREVDGKSERYYFSLSKPYVYDDVKEALAGPCSILEMMVAFCKRIEQLKKMWSKGDRTGEWFWNMLVNMRIANMNDDRYDPEYVNERLDIMIYREYDYFGDGGLFYAKNPPKDMRETNLWYQMQYSLDDYDDFDN